MNYSVEQILDYLEKKLGREPTNEDLRTIMNGTGLLLLIDEMEAKGVEHERTGRNRFLAIQD